MILGIESSCDDSSLALLSCENLELVLHKKISQESEHAVFGGVVPELAARLHTKALPALLEYIKPYLKRIKAVAVTCEPGLSVSLISGVSMAKALHISLGVPLIGVNHLVGHVYSLFLDRKADFPMGILLVSGGHTLVLDIDENAKISVLASTGDDSFGESFDKVAKMLGLAYPGGAIISSYAQKCQNKTRFNFTIPLLHDKRLEYSFSGLKNQVRLAIENLDSINETNIADIAYAFEQTACSHIADKLQKIFAIKKWRKFGVVGGASANLILRARLEKICAKFDSQLFLAPLQFCSDNAAMIARAGLEKYKKAEFLSHQELQISPKSKEILIPC
ncbi:MAG: tRNA (adenosine(37)-N6)-threonylcarbamoyltransferase complex transferase subunit TsaD [Campylobacter sp.]|nr:tRNA (adenosine(37)-N6)-threonylcarbamoyltransferase complex transferase subunit TsaD [Campylobacter sp.]